VLFTLFSAHDSQDIEDDSRVSKPALRYGSP